MKFQFDSRHVRRSVVIVLGALTLGVSIGAAVSSEIGGASSGPAGMTPGAIFPRNASGLTYGSALGALGEAGVPDLILVVATNGKQGYVYRSALNAADGSTVSSPRGAAAWTAGGARTSVSGWHSVTKTRHKLAEVCKRCHEKLGLHEGQIRDCRISLCAGEGHSS